MAASDRVLEALESYGIHSKKAGGDNVIALCPFHDDHSPSFCINVQNGLFICYACGEKGTFWQFLTKMGMRPEEIRFNYGKTIQDLKKNQPPPPDPTKPEVVMPPNKHLPEDLVGLFKRCPDKLTDEGFQEKVLLEFGVGVDLVNQRITFPLRDLEGNLVGISGRALDDAVEPRYKVYRDEYRAWELPPYETDKDKLLWNAHRIYPEVMRTFGETPIVLVEGFKACMWVHQAGFKNVVALMTRKLSWTQQKILEQMGGPFIIFGDNDEFGADGVVSVSASLAKTSRVKIVEYDARQPSDVPLDEVLHLIETATPYYAMIAPS